MSRSPDELVLAACAGDRAAAAELLSVLGPQVRGRISGKIASKWRSVLEEDDVMQVSYLEAFLRLERFSPSGPSPSGAFVAWLTTIAENNLRDAVRELERAKRPNPSRRVEPVVNDESYNSLVGVLGVTLTTPSKHAAKGEASRLLDAAITELPQDYQKVIRLYDLEQRDPADVAREMGRSSGAVFMLRARAHDRLKEILGGGSRFFSTGG